ncbi:MAG TPA: hypothetical protein PKE63_05690 [Lacibacter sp.]|nr:hypothetical protein [Lacibacter sp.]HMO89888.1 hypothetical protein [Lacibacter sp.]HMP86749.1 hypothetical protein [Lacibacter sp.]
MKRLWAFVPTILPFLLYAHPGHGETEGFTIKHYMVEPEHVVLSLLALAITIFFLGRRKEMRDVQQKP